MYDFDKDKDDKKKRLEIINEIANKILNSDFYVTTPDWVVYRFNREPPFIWVECEADLKKEIESVYFDKTNSYVVKEVIEKIKRNTIKKNLKLNSGSPHEVPCFDGVFNILNFTVRNYNPHTDFFTKYHPVKLGVDFGKVEPVANYYFVDEVDVPPEQWNDLQKSRGGGEYTCVYKFDLDKMNELIVAEKNPIGLFVCEVVEKGKSKFLFEWVGYCFYRGLPFQNFLVLVGNASTGKSSFLQILQRMAGLDWVSGRSIQDLSENRFAIIDLKDKLINIYPDLSPRALNDEAVVKVLTGDAFIFGEAKFKQPEIFHNYAKLIFSANELPTLKGYGSDALFRRMFIVKFPDPIAKPDVNIVEKLCTEENMRNFFLFCCWYFRDVLIKTKKFSYGLSVEERRDLYLQHTKSWEYFCDEYLVVDTNSTIYSDDLYNVYVTFCKKFKVKEYNRKWFFKFLNEKFKGVIHRGRSGELYNRAYYYENLAWVDEKKKELLGDEKL
jgi:P4 family phage/plasmid primase-like protien